MRNQPRTFAANWFLIVAPTLTFAEGHSPLAKAPFNAAQAKRFQQQWATHIEKEVVETNSISMKNRRTTIRSCTAARSSPTMSSSMTGNITVGMPRMPVNIKRRFASAMRAVNLPWSNRLTLTTQKSNRPVKLVSNTKQQAHSHSASVMR